jgi:hypothetical protein
MRKIIFMMFIIILNVNGYALDNQAEKDSSWFDSTKEGALKAFDATKKVTEKGIDKTGKFLNKTGKATKDGFKAFKQSFDDENTSKSIEKKVTLPPYLSVDGYQACVSIKKSGSLNTMCLSKYRPALCKGSVFEQLQQLNSPEPC